MENLPDNAEVLVLGASGGIGREFTRQLLAEPAWAGSGRARAALTPRA